MPKIEQICNTFRAVPHTARRALKKLKDDSLIYVSPGRNTIITYTAVPEEMQRFTKEYYLSRKNAISQVYMIANLLLMPIYQEGISGDLPMQKNVKMAAESIQILLITAEDIFYNQFPLLTDRQLKDLKSFLLSK